MTGQALDEAVWAGIAPIEELAEEIAEGVKVDENAEPIPEEIRAYLVRRLHAIADDVEESVRRLLDDPNLRPWPKRAETEGIGRA